MAVSVSDQDVIYYTYFRWLECCRSQHTKSVLSHLEIFDTVRFSQMRRLLWPVPVFMSCCALSIVSEVVQTCCFAPSSGGHVNLDSMEQKSDSPDFALTSYQSPKSETKIALFSAKNPRNVNRPSNSWNGALANSCVGRPFYAWILLGGKYILLKLFTHITADHTAS